MLCPEIWNFKAPKDHIEYHEDINRGTNAINTHYLNHSVSVVLPNISSIPESFIDNIVQDSDYYRIDNLRVVELINKEFIEAFIKKGELSLLSIEKKIDIHNIAAVTPTGHLILSLVRESYQKLGLEGKPTYFEKKNHSRYGKSQERALM